MRLDRKNRAGGSPLSAIGFEVLLSLVDGERHGYSIMRDIEERTSNNLTVHPGTLYRAINRLVVTGLLLELEERPDPAKDDQRRRYYRLTALGRRTARAEARRLAGQVAAARAKKLLTTE